ncbi:hypothetical protein IFM89_006223, partial [Coptis chinensis]
FLVVKATGRFCNGRLATDSSTCLYAFGIKPFIPAYLDYGIEDFATGVNFASVTGSGTSHSVAENGDSAVLRTVRLKWKQNHEARWQGPRWWCKIMCMS